MYSVRLLPEFEAWINTLEDVRVRDAVIARIKRVSGGLMGDVASVGDEVSELRIHLGAGWRLYFTRRGRNIVILLAGGSKQSQAKDIKRAKKLAALLVTEEEK